METDEVIVNLKIIANIKKGDRITTTSPFLNIEQRSLVPECIRRWKAGEGRNESIRKINIIVNNALISKTPIQDYLLACIEGLRNLQDTYTGDLQTVSRIDTIIDKIQKHTQTDF
jgi:hypothetical protein